MSLTRVSVLIPVFNGESYVGKAIRSVLGQTLRDLEVVVLDDGSTDRSARLARSFGDQRVRVYRRDQHEGAAATRNHLLLVARAPLVAFLDADDVALAERLNRQVAFLDRHRDHALVSCSYYQIDAQGQTVRHRPLPTEHDALARRLLHGNALPASTVVVRREALEAAGGFDAALGLAAEYDLFLKVAEKSRIAALSEPLVKCRVHARAASYENRHALRDGLDEARRRAVRRRHRRCLTLARRADDPQPLLFAPSGEPAGAVPAGLTLVVEPAEAATPPPAAQPAVAESCAAAPAEPPAAAAALPGQDASANPADPGPTQLALVPVAESGDSPACPGAAADASPPGPSPAAAPGEAADAKLPSAAEAGAPAPTAEAAAPPPAIVAADGESGSNDSPAPAVAEPAEPPTEREAVVAVIVEASGRAALGAVRSVLDQTLRDVVVAVVATRHDEGLERGLELLADDRILLLEAIGAGRAHALNLGILATRSRYLAYLGESGVYRPEHLEKLVQAADGDRLGFVYSDLGLATPGVPGTLVAGRDFDGELLLKENFIPTEAVLHRRDLLHEVGLFNEGLDDGMEWEMWVYLTRVAAARRVPHTTVERVVGGPKATRLIAPSPNRVRRYLAEKFSRSAAEAAARRPESPAEAPAPDGEHLSRAQERIRRGDWAGAAAELVDAASRQLSQWSHVFSPRFPERELPAAELPAALLADDPAVRRVRPRTVKAEVSAALPEAVGAERALTREILPHRLSAAASPASWLESAAAAGGFRLASEPAVEAEAAARGREEAAAPGGGTAKSAWMRIGGRLVPRQRPSPFAPAGPRPAAGARAAATLRATPSSCSRPAGGLPGRRKRPTENLLQHPGCPRCGAEDTVLAYRAGWYRVLDCKACDVGFSFPRLEPSSAVRFFSDRRPEIVPPHVRTAEDCRGTRWDRSRELGWATKRVSGGRLADVGCSWGFAMAQAAALGYEPFGTELSRSLARTARERFGFEVKERDFADLGLEEGSLDVVLAVHVIQHLVDPVRFFAEAARALRPGGVMVGALPNFDAWLKDELGRRWKWLDPECQPFHFRPASLARLLGEAGFETEVWTSEGLYGEEALAEIVGPVQAQELARSGRGSEIGFVACRR